MVKEQDDLLKRYSQNGADALATFLTNDLGERKIRALEEDGLDRKMFQGLFFRLGVSDEERYQIKCDNQTVFVLPRPDMLGHVHPKAYVDGEEYVSSDSMKLTDVLTFIKRYCLERGQEQPYLWNADIVESWREQEATYKQENFIRHLLRKKGLNQKGAEKLSKYDATLLIDFFLQNKKLKNHVHTLSQNFRSLKKQLQEEAYVDAANVMSEKEKRDFAKLVVSDEWQSDTEKPENIVLSIPVTPNLHFPTRCVRASDRQKGYATGLCNTLCGKGCSFDINMGKLIDTIEYAFDISNLIDLLKRIKDSSEIVFSANPTICFSQIVDRMLTQRPGCTNTYCVPVQYI